MYLLYNLALWLATPLLLPWVAYRALRGRLPGLGQRLGLFSWEGSSAGAPVVWIHAVSLGEVSAAGAFIKELRNRFPKARIVMTSSTRTGWNAARRLLSPQELVLYPPWDLRFVCRRFLRRIKPQAVVIVETELWPNLFRECKRYGAVLLLANGRISEKTFPRYLASRFLWRHVLGQPDGLFLQSSADASRFKALGAPAEKVHVLGNLKFASRPRRSPIVDALRKSFRDSSDSTAGPVIVAGSTMPGEEKYLLEAFLQLLPEFPRLWMILAPRHPDRFTAVTEQVQALGIPFQLRSQWKAPTTPILPGVLILDSMGELGAFYELATVAYVGGTLVATGGHNILEPAYFARPIVIGPSMTNFQEIADEFLQDAGLLSAASAQEGVGRVPVGDYIRIGSIIQVPDAAALTPVFRFLFLNPAFRRRLGEAARDRSQRNLGGAAPVVAPIVDELQRLLALPGDQINRRSPAPQQETVGAAKME